MEIKDWSYEAFPEFTQIPEGAGCIASRGDEVGVHLYANVPYQTVDDVTLHLEILRPYTRNEGEERILPCMVYVQGSAWMEQDMFKSLPLYARLAQRGYVVAVVEYRHSGIAPFPAPIIDACNAVRYMRLHAADYHIDAARIYLGGCSSGGHTAVFGGFRHNDDTAENAYPGISAQVCAVLDEYGSVSVMREDANPSTTNHLLPESPEGMEAGGVNLRERPDLRRAMSAECNITSTTQIPPTLIIHGTKDRTVNPAVSADLYEHMKACGKEVSLYMIRGADHGGPEFWTDEVLDIIQDFLERAHRPEHL